MKAGCLPRFFWLLLFDFIWLHFPATHKAEPKGKIKWQNQKSRFSTALSGFIGYFSLIL